MTKEIDLFSKDKTIFENRVYNEPVRLITKDEPVDSISFQNVIFNKDISFDLNQIIEERLTISFLNCSIKSFSDLSLRTINLNLGFRSCFVGSLRVESGNINWVDINNCFGNFFINKVESINISYTEENIFIRLWKNIKSLEQLNMLLSFKTRFHITNVKKINIYGHEIGQSKKNKLIKNRKLRSEGKYKNFFLNDNDLKNFRLRRYLSMKEKQKLDINISLNYNLNHEHVETSIRNLILNSITLKGKTKGEVQIDDCFIHQIYINGFSPKSDFSMHSIKPSIASGKFEVRNSNLDNTWFNGVRLKDYFVVFHKSSFINTKFSSTVFPSVKELKNSISSVKNIHYPKKIKSRQEFNRDMYELFLELNQAFDKRGNSHEAQKMKSVANDFLYDIERWKLSKSDFWNNKLVLGLNKLTNFHGISIRNAFISVASIICFFHCLNLITFESIKWGFDSWSNLFNVIDNNIQYLFVIANPAHKISSLTPEGEMTGWTYTVSFFSRIFIGYSYYQFITAFRRFGK